MLLPLECFSLCYGSDLCFGRLFTLVGLSSGCLFTLIGLLLSLRSFSFGRLFSLNCFRFGFRPGLTFRK